MDTTYSNPRRDALILDWPLGGNKRGEAQFVVERTAKGERVMRTTTGKPVFTSYGKQARIVDGDDGRTYLVLLSPHFEHVSVMRGDMKIQHEAIMPSADPERYASVLALFDDKSDQP